MQLSALAVNSNQLEAMASSSSRVSKPTLARIAGLTRISDLAIAAVVSILGEQESGRNTSAAVRKRLHSAIQKPIEDAHVLKAPSLPPIRGQPVQWVCAQPQRPLQYLYDHCLPFAAAMASATAGGRGSHEHPLRLIFYVDGITPGNVLSPDNTRKFTIFYFGLLEFGRFRLQQDVAWVVGGACSESRMNTQSMEA